MTLSPRLRLVEVAGGAAFVVGFVINDDELRLCGVTQHTGEMLIAAGLLLIVARHVVLDRLWQPSLLMSKLASVFVFSLMAIGLVNNVVALDCNIPQGFSHYIGAILLTIGVMFEFRLEVKSLMERSKDEKRKHRFSKR